MKSRVVYTSQIDDTALAARELIDKALDGFEPLKSSVGILYCYSDMEVGELAQYLRQGLDFDIIGCTCIASMEQEQGFHDMAATLTIITSDSHSIATAVSQPITPENVSGQIEQTYRQLESSLGHTPGLVFALPPYMLDIMLDIYPVRFNEIAPGVPVVGGLPSYNATGDINVTISNDLISPDRLVLLGISGDIRPVFSVQNVTSDDVNRKRRVTSARDNKVYTVGGQPFTEYLEEIGLQVDKLAQGNATITFVSNPLLLESAEDGYSFARTLHEVDPAEGSGTAIGAIPEGSILSVCSLKSDQIVSAAADGMTALKELMAKQSGYTYSTVFAISCIGRHLLLLPDNRLEAEKLRDELPSGLTLTGFYSYGEIGPQGISQNQNFAHNESLVLCAF